MRTWPLLLLALLLPAADALAQNPETPPPPCSRPEFRQLDFWVGEWTGTWEGGGGTNVITRTLGDCVLEENFSGTMPTGFEFQGHSVSTYNVRKGLWQQTWVDNQGAYLDFTGGPEGDTFVLSRAVEVNGQMVHQRMVFHDIQEDSFEWSWERSTDGGETWAQTWLIHYRRAGS